MYRRDMQLIVWMVVTCIVCVACGKDDKQPEPSAAPSASPSPSETSSKPPEKPPEMPPPSADPHTEAEQAAAAARQAAEEAVREAEAAKEAVDRLNAEVEEQNKKLEALIDEVTKAQTDADRETARVKLQALRNEQAELQARIAEARAKAARAERTKGVKIPQHCLDNPLAKGCS